MVTPLIEADLEGHPVVKMPRKSFRISGHGQFSLVRPLLYPPHL